MPIASEIGRQGDGGADVDVEVEVASEIGMQG